MNLYVFVISAFRKALKINSGTSGYLVRAVRSDSYIFLDVKEAKNFKTLKLHIFAEAEGFEPSDPKRINSFQDCRYRPLSQTSFKSGYCDSNTGLPDPKSGTLTNCATPRKMKSTRIKYTHINATIISTLQKIRTVLIRF